MPILSLELATTCTRPSAKAGVEGLASGLNRANPLRPLLPLGNRIHIWSGSETSPVDANFAPFAL